MMFEHNSKNRKTIFTLFIISSMLLLLGLLYFLLKGGSAPDSVACTMDAKLCPDGSAVGRVGPDCEFAPCPTEESSWQEVVRAIQNCEVEQVFQAHSREVSITYKDGQELRAVEPTIDDIIDIAIAAEPDCGKVLMATE